MRGGLVYMALTRAWLEEMEMRVSFAVHSDGPGW